MSRENVEIVRRLFAHWERGDFWTMADAYDPEVEWHWSRHGTALVGGESYRGLAEVAAAMRNWLADWEWFSVAGEKFIDVDDRVVVFTRIHARLRDGRGEVHDQQTNVVTVRAGKIARIESYDDRADALEAVGLRE